MADRDEPHPVDRDEVASKVTSIADRIRRRDAQRAVDKARRKAADHTWTADSTLELAEHAALLEELDLDTNLPEGDDPLAREARAGFLCARANRAHLRGDDEAAFADWALALETADHADSYILRGAVHCARGETDSALADLDRAAELAPTDPAVYFRRGEVFARLGDHERALANYRRCQQLAPDLLSNLSVMATSYLALGDGRAALGVLDRAVRAAPHYADLYLRRALCHFGLESYDAALRDYDRSLELNPRQPVVLRLRSSLLQLRGLHEQAIADLERALEIDPDEIENRRALGWARVLQAPDQAPVAQLTALMELTPDQDILHFLRAQALRREGDLRGAIADLETATRLDPTSLSYVMTLSAVVCEVEGQAACLVHLDRIISLAPTDARLWGARGRIRARDGKYPESLVDLDTAISLDPQNVMFHFERAKVLHALDDDEGAANAMTRVIEIEPEKGEHYAWRGCYRIALDDPREEVLADLERGVELAPEVSVSWFYRAMFFETEERWEEALRDLEEAIAREPTMGVLYYRRGVCRRGLGSEQFDRAWDEAPEEEGPTEEEEERFLECNRKAIVDFEHCIELGTKNWQVYDQLFHAHGELEDPEKGDGGYAALSATIEAGAPGPLHHYLRASMRRNRGDDAGARSDMATALKLGWSLQDPEERQRLQAFVDEETTPAPASAEASP